LRSFKTNLLLLLLTAALLLHSFGEVLAQRKKTPTGKQQPSVDEKVAVAKADLVKAAADYKASLEQLLTLQQAELKSAEDDLKKKKALPANIIARTDIEESERAVQGALSKLADTRRQIGETDDLIAEVRAAEQLARMPRLKAGGYYSTEALIRYAGTGSWLISNAAQIETFFAARFNRPLPISARGQTAVHDRLGFDHRNSLDVAVHPDSAEGQALMSFLRSAGIPFIAFRHAVAGSATGAHIHIGYPSRRSS
jgi:hypothetical protein